MAKGKDVIVKITLECDSCVRNDINKESGAFPDILLKRINTMHLVDWN